MSDTVEQHEVTWAADTRTLLEIAISSLPSVGVAVSPIVDVEWAGSKSYAVRISSTAGPLRNPPTGVRIEASPVAGVFMTGPRRSVSIRALLLALTGAGFISREEALAAAKTGDIPSSLRAPLFAAVDADAQFQIELVWAAMYEAERISPFWSFVVAAGIATDEQIDAVFAAASAA